MLRIVAHVLLFILALVVFYLGLGIGLALNPALGTLLWLVSAGIAVGNILWIVRWIVPAKK